MGEKYCYLLLSYGAIAAIVEWLGLIETLNRQLLRFTAEICPSCNSQLGQEFRKLLEVVSATTGMPVIAPIIQTVWVSVCRWLTAAGWVT